MGSLIGDYRNKTQVKITSRYDFKHTRVGNINILINVGLGKDEEPGEMTFISVSSVQSLSCVRFIVTP